MEEMRTGKVKICKKTNNMNKYNDNQGYMNYYDQQGYINSYDENQMYVNDINTSCYNQNEQELFDVEDLYEKKCGCTNNNYTKENNSMSQNYNIYENSSEVEENCNTEQSSSCNNGCNCGCCNTDNSTSTSGCCSGACNTGCLPEELVESNCVANACETENQCCTPIKVKKFNTKNVVPYPVQITRIIDSISFTQYANAALTGLDWTATVSCGTLPSTGTAYSFKVKEICIGDNSLESEASETITLGGTELTEGTTLFDGPTSNVTYYGFDNYNSCCCQNGLGTSLTYSRTGLEYSLAAPAGSDEDTIPITLRGTCGCAQITATAEISGTTDFTFNNVSGRICVPSSTLASFLQRVNQLKLGFGCIQGATITGAAGEDGGATTYTVSIPDIQLILCLTEIISSLSLEQTAVLGLNQDIEPREMPIAPQICSFVTCPSRR